MIFLLHLLIMPRRNGRKPFRIGLVRLMRLLLRIEEVLKLRLLLLCSLLVDVLSQILVLRIIWHIRHLIYLINLVWRLMARCAKIRTKSTHLNNFRWHVPIVFLLEETRVRLYPRPSLNISLRLLHHDLMKHPLLL